MKIPFKSNSGPPGCRCECKNHTQAQTKTAVPRRFGGAGFSPVPEQFIYGVKMI